MYERLCVCTVTHQEAAQAVGRVMARAPRPLHQVKQDEPLHDLSKVTGDAR